MKPWLALLLLSATPALCQNWNGWRGPDRSGHASMTGPELWPETLERRFRVEVGEGHASPASVGGRIFVFTREGNEERLRALTLADGSEIWSFRTEAPYEMNSAATAHGKGPKSSPVVGGGRVFTLGISGTLSAHDADDGALLWQHEATGSPLYGQGASPLLADDKLIAHVGADRDGALTAYEPASGRILWAHEGDGPGYASPILYERHGERHVVTQTDSHIVAVKLSDGTLVWRLPFSTPYDQNSITPISLGDSLVLGGLEQNTFALDLTLDTPRELWRSPLTFYMSTPIAVDDKLVGFSDKKSGHFVVIDQTTGNTVWTGPPRTGDNASLVLMGDKILALTVDGVLTVRQLTTDGLETERSYDVANSPTWAHLVPTEEGILVKEERHLSLWDLP